MSFEPPFRGIASDGFAAHGGNGLVIGTDPRSRALIRHLSGQIGMNSGQKLIMKMCLFSIWTVEYGIDSVRVLGLVQMALGDS